MRGRGEKGPTLPTRPDGRPRNLIDNTLLIVIASGPSTASQSIGRNLLSRKIKGQTFTFHSLLNLTALLAQPSQKGYSNAAHRKTSCANFIACDWHFCLFWFKDNNG